MIIINNNNCTNLHLSVPNNINYHFPIRKMSDTSAELEKTPLLQKPKKTQDYLALAAVTFIKFGDYVEICLPAVISQPIACEMGINKSQEHILAIAFYLSLALMSLIMSRMANMFGRRSTILAGLYVTELMTVLCAVVPNYATLLMSRIMLGLTVGSIFSTNVIYMAEIASSQEFYKLSILISTIFFTFGGAWCGLLGYFFLDLIGWRYFFLVSSLPLFLPPLIIFQFFLPETYRAEDRNSPEVVLESAGNVPSTSSRDMIVRAVLISMFTFLYCIYFYGEILLIPSIAKYANEINFDNTPCNAIHGSQFLVLTLVFGICHVLGAMLWYFMVYLRISSFVILTLSSSLIAVTYGIMSYHIANIKLLYVGIAVIQILAMLTNQEAHFICSDTTFFTSKFLAASVSLSTVTFSLSCLFGNFVSEVLDYSTAIYIQFACCVMSLFCAAVLTKGHKVTS